MQFRLIRDLVQHLTDDSVTAEFMKAVELRQRVYQDLRSDVLILDQYDLIADHLLLYSADGNLMAYIRAVTEAKCNYYSQKLPISELVKQFPETEWGYRQFRKQAKDVVQIFYLCLDPRYRSELKGVKAVELFVWLAVTVSEVPTERVSFAFTINTRYHQDAVLKELGEWIPNVPDVQHPVIPDLHRFVFVPKIRADYWEQERQKFVALYTSLSDGTRDLLELPSEKSRKEA